MAPDDGFKIENLGTGSVERHSRPAIRVLVAGLGNPGYLTQIVDRVDHAVGPSQRPKRSQLAEFPHKAQTLQARAIPAEVLVVWILEGSFGLAAHLAEQVDAKRSAVWSSESGRADIRDLSVQPERGMRRAVSGSVRAGYQPKVVQRRGAEYRAKIGDGVAGRVRR